MLAPLPKRADFLRLAKARKGVKDGLILQMDACPISLPGVIRTGFTATKKLGGAVERNRTKRRLRAVARAILPLYGQAGCDYVLIGREATRDRPYLLLLGDLKAALGIVHGRNARKPS